LRKRGHIEVFTRNFWSFPLGHGLQIRQQIFGGGITRRRFFGHAYFNDFADALRQFVIQVICGL
jgi:hypothetical protein